MQSPLGQPAPGKDEGLIKELANLAPLERLGSPEDIAGVVSFLVGADGGWVNAQVFACKWRFRPARGARSSKASFDTGGDMQKSLLSPELRASFMTTVSSRFVF